MVESGNADRRAGVLVGGVGVHLLLTLGHGVSHATVPVPVGDWQAAYTAVVVFGLPVVGALLAQHGRIRTGVALVLAAGVGALVFEGLFHFLLANPDHVTALGAGSGSFVATAILSTAGDLLLVVVAGWLRYST